MLQGDNSEVLFLDREIYQLRIDGHGECESVGGRLGGK